MPSVVPYETAHLFPWRHTSSRSRMTSEPRLMKEGDMVCTRAHAFAASLVLATVFALPSLAQGVDADQIATTRRQMTATRLACSRRRRSLASEVQSDSKPHFRDDLCRNRMHRLFRDAGLWGTPRNARMDASEPKSEKGGESFGQAQGSGRGEVGIRSEIR